MKVLQVINSLYIGGAEKLLVDSIPMYIAKGLDVEVLLLDGMQTDFYKKLKAKNITIHTSRRLSIYNPLHAIEIVKYLRNYDVIHIHLFPAQYWTIIAKWLSFSKVKIVTTEHNTYNRRMKYRFFSIIEKIVYSSFDAIICITDEVKEILDKHLKIENAPFIVIYNGIDIKSIKQSLPLNRENIHPLIKASDTLIIQVSSYRDQKDQATLIRSLVHLPDFYKLLLIGDGPNKIKCEELVNQLGVQSRVVFFNSRMDIFSLLKASDVVVLSTKYEGLSLSSIEGMASGKPFIGSNVPGLKDLVHGAGLLFEQGNEVDLAVKIKLLINDSNQYAEVKNSCLKRAEKYDIDTMVSEYIQLYERLTL